MTNRQNDSAKLDLKDIREIYRDYCNGYNNDPFVSPVLRLALDINQGLQSGDISLQDVTETVSDITNSGLVKRANNIARYLGCCNTAENTDKIDNLFEALTKDNAGNKIAFDDFKGKIERVFYGFVFTAHPTFTMSHELSENLSGYAASLANGQNHISLEDLYSAAKIPFSPPDINDENTLSLYAIDNLHHVIELMLNRLFTVTAKHYPDQWQDLRPQLFSLATWVGFDIDGRRDISWTTTLEKRIFLQISQLNAYQARLASLIQSHPTDCVELQKPLTKIEATLVLLKELHHSFAGYKQETDTNLEQLQILSRRLVSTATERLTCAEPLINDINAVLSATKDNGVKIELMMLLTQLRNFGLSRAEVHFRINATQLHNAINDQITLGTHPDHPTKRRQYIQDISDLINNLDAVNIDFGDIAEEEITAKYEFMLIQKITQYVDSDSPIRFLIAETESAFTVLTAFYYAKKFGVADKIDICPLFETDKALQNSSRYINALLDNPDFCDYLTQRGRLCIQTGYSDAGRYIGQPAAGASIERLKERFIELFKEREIKDISLLFFDTHGESIGRGGHPESFHKRMEYIASPYVLSQAALGNISYTQESSYQGGDGFLNFMNKETSLAVLTRTLEYWLKDHNIVIDDPYYTEPFRSDVTRFFTRSTRFQLSLTNNPKYADLLFAFSTHMMNPSGSRAVKRQRAEHLTISKRQSVTDIRAIPTNAILGQMGLFVNTVSGMGRAVREYDDFASDIVQKSPRFQNILSLINAGMEMSDPHIMRAYINVLDPTLWITQANACLDSRLSNKMASIATHLEKHNFHDGMMEMFRKVYWDYTLLNRFDEINSKPHPNDIERACLHALRIALIQRVFVLATDIPRYGRHNPVSRTNLLKTIFHMNIDDAVDVLKDVFPARVLKTGDYDFGETSEYRNKEDAEGYTALQNSIITPMQDIHKITKDISTALTHYIGFFG